MFHGGKFFAFLFLLCVVECNVIDEFIAEKMAEGHIGALSGSMLFRDNVIWSNSYGNLEPANTESPKCTNETIFMLASISKTIMSVAIMELFEKNLFSLDDDVNLYLPFPVHNPYYPQNIITVRMLLTHTSSINDFGYLTNFVDFYSLGDSNIPLGDFLYSYLTPSGVHYNQSSNYFDTKPGEYYAYSNVGATLAGFLVEGILYTKEGKETQFFTETQNNVFVPLSMYETYWHLNNFTDIGAYHKIATPSNYADETYSSICQYGYPDYPSGALRTSESQLRRFFGMFINNGTWQGTTLLSPATVELMSTVQPGLESEGQALIWHYKKQHSRTLLGHSGGDFGVATDMFFNPQSQIGFIILTNGDWSQPGFTKAITEIENFLLDIFDPQNSSISNTEPFLNETKTNRFHTTNNAAEQICSQPWLWY